MGRLRGVLRCRPAAVLVGAMALPLGDAAAHDHCDAVAVNAVLESAYRADLAFRQGSGLRGDVENLAQLERIIARCGWPARSRYGDRAALTAFLIVQHAGLDDQLRLLPLLEQAEAAGELGTGWLPLLHDRIRVRQGQPQRYGTQLQGACVPFPIEAPETLEQRRQAAGLMPYGEYLATCRDRPVGGSL